jgi:hypothetical protein
MGEAGDSKGLMGSTLSPVRGLFFFARGIAGIVGIAGHATRWEALCCSCPSALISGLCTNSAGSFGATRPGIFSPTPLAAYGLVIAWPIVTCVSIHSQAAALVWNGPATECSARPRDTPTKNHVTSCAPARCSYIMNTMNGSLLIAPSSTAEDGKPRRGITRRRVDVRSFDWDLHP